MALDWVQKALREGLGFSPYPATLNLKLESRAEIDLWRGLKREMRGVAIPAPDPSFCQARCFLVDIEGKVRGAVLVPGIDGYPEDKIEVIAPVRLKDGLRVRDGDRVILEFVG